MRSDDARAREARDWLTKAAEDLGSCQALMDSGYFSNALFLCQQAAEKSLKAFLTWHNRPFRRTHDIEELGEVCRAVDNTLAAALLEEADILSDYAWKLRYPGSPYTPERKEVENMLGVAKQVFQEVQSRLPPEARISGTHDQQE